ncbi:hypothetical protein [Flavobacterium luteum]|uniref:Uncharacterized protein n=1 Tax=Flavobacterium luteum TaxID=2026654 RepID=A0A7J5ALT1_9FLAO|nr:hypothetical protein [Flavobacterium luteum]KAB1157949.1 hypothetical protein F6464_02375 [Flavobacterium luteum]
MVIRYFYTRPKYNLENSNRKEHEVAYADNQLSVENSIEIDKCNEEANILDNQLPSYPEVSKNMFLYPDEGFIKDAGANSIHQDLNNSNSINHLNELGSEDFNSSDKITCVSIIDIDQYHKAVDESSLKENINELNESNEALDRLENEKALIIQTSKNKWLYPDDEFGKMERGRSF